MWKMSSRRLWLVCFICLVSTGLSKGSSAQGTHFVKELVVTLKGNDAVGVASQIYKYDENNEKRLDFLTATDVNGFKSLNEYCDPEDHIIAHPNDDGIYTP